MVNRKLSVLLVKVQLNTLNLPRDTINLVIDLAIVQNAIQISTLGTYGLNRFHNLIDHSNTNRFNCPDFVIY